MPEKVTRIESDSNLRGRMKEREGGPIFTECLLWAGLVLSAFHVLSSKNFDKVATFYPYHFMDEETEMQRG